MDYLFRSVSYLPTSMKPTDKMKLPHTVHAIISPFLVWITADREIYSESAPLTITRS